MLGRRIVLAVSPSDCVRGLRIVSSEVHGTMFGGTVKTVLGVENGVKGKALDIRPGGVALKPFLSSRTLQPQTSTVDVVLLPGGAPIDEAAVLLPTLRDWGKRATSATFIAVVEEQNAQQLVLGAVPVRRIPFLFLDAVPRVDTNTIHQLAPVKFCNATVGRS